MLKEPIRGPITPSELLNDVEKLQNTRTSSIEHLPAFSFSKKPVSACSSETTGSNITTGLSQGTSKSKIKLSQPCEIMNFDYDEQIRYPRMRNGYFDISSSPRKGSFKKTASLEHEEAVTKSGNYEPTTKSGNYEPATFDINPTIRRFSTHVNDNLGQEYKKNNYIYGDSFESNLNLIHEMRKPMMTPAVLRPPAETKPPQFLTASYTIINIAENGLTIEEPSHQHWWKNTSTCMSCKKPFYNYFVSLLYDSPTCHRHRHHCRFCGLVYCTDCLSTSTIIMDKLANFVIPIYRNNPTFRGKNVKTCQKCTFLYHTLVEKINNSEHSGLNVTESFLLVENPHIHNLPEFRYLKKFKRLKITQGYADLEEDANTSDRRMSIVDDVTTDWSWSSF